MGNSAQEKEEEEEEEEAASRTSSSFLVDQGIVFWYVQAEYTSA